MSVKIDVQDYTEDLFSGSVVTRLEQEKVVSILNENTIIGQIKEGELGSEECFSLKTEAYLLQLAYTNNKILSLSNSRTRILAHQVESTHRIVNALQQRFILADEVGLGKTVEAGLVIKEMIYRYNYRRILIACPASLLVQWQHEMEDKFGEEFEILDRKVLDKRRAACGENENPWKTFTKVICSLDFIKNDSFVADLQDTHWDAIIFDEAHRLRRDAQTSTLTYNVAELLSQRAHSFLLLTATPFRGKLEELYYLVRLVDKNLLGPFQSFYNEYCMPESDLSLLKDKLSSVIIRRTKKEIGGFTKRFARTIRFELYPEEHALYEATTRYVVEEFNKALQTENRAIGFVMTVFQKLLDSSSYALLSALKNRKIHLQGLYEKACRSIGYNDIATALLAEEEVEGPNAIEQAEMLEDAEDIDSIIACSVQKTADELKEEISTIENLLRLASSITRNKKAEKLREMIDSLKEKGHEKFLIFTQFRTTQDYLTSILTGYKVEVFHGSMDKDQKEDAIENFKGDTEILICTEAGGEGRNMQFCNILFNYDLPWSPLKIEQRIGRLHRFGQKYDVFVYNFSTKDTVAERVLDVLTQKLHLFEESIGTPDITLGQIEDELTLNSLFMDMTSGRKSKKQIFQEVEESYEMAKKSFDKLSELTVAKKMDFNYDEYYKITQRERQFSNKQLESFIVRLHEAENMPLAYMDTRKNKKELFKIRQMPAEGKHHQYGTFNSEIALKNSNLEFLAFGHPIVDSCISYCQGNDFQGVTGTKVIDYEKPLLGIVNNYLVTYSSVSTTRELLPVFVAYNETFNDYEYDEIEREISKSYSSRNSGDEKDRRLYVQQIIENIEDLNQHARERILQKVEHKVWDLKESLDLSIDPEIEKITESYNKAIKELEEKLIRQENQMNFFQKEMKSVISRTKNKIYTLKKEKEHSLARYRRYLGITYKIELINTGIIVSKSVNEDL